eukprot:3941451-Rhodomonas_salina.3
MARVREAVLADTLNVKVGLVPAYARATRCPVLTYGLFWYQDASPELRKAILDGKLAVLLRLKTENSTTELAEALSRAVDSGQLGRSIIAGVQADYATFRYAVRYCHSLGGAARAMRCPVPIWPVCGTRTQMLPKITFEDTAFPCDKVAIWVRPAIGLRVYYAMSGTDVVDGSMQYAGPSWREMMDTEGARAQTYKGATLTYQGVSDPVAQAVAAPTEDRRTPGTSCLHAPYAMSGTDILYAVRHTRVLRDVRYWHSGNVLSGNDTDVAITCCLPTHFPVLSELVVCLVPGSTTAGG